jgi:hypothetical protein
LLYQAKPDRYREAQDPPSQSKEAVVAARKNKGTKEMGWPANVRERIQTSMLVNRLTNHALGKVKMTPSQVRAIEILLRKTLPDLQSTELSGGLDVMVSHEQALDQLE